MVHRTADNYIQAARDVLEELSLKWMSFYKDKKNHLIKLSAQ
jgi:hypothetical protein